MSNKIYEKFDCREMVLSLEKVFSMTFSYNKPSIVQLSEFLKGKNKNRKKASKLFFGII